MFKNPWKLLGIIIIFVFLGFTFSVMRNVFHVFGEPEVSIGKKVILVVDLEGVIIDGKKFLAQLKKYSRENSVKGVLVRINSPGGVVGPSQEIYSELKYIREKLKKPVVVSANAVMASGGYYAAVAADKIVTNAGTLTGSIGVIMEFANLEKLYDWAKIQKFSITTGAYKDTGSESRPMREDEKRFIKSMLDEVLEQFKHAVSEGRKLDMQTVTKLADGRIFTGANAVKLGLADEVGTFEDARRIIGQMTHLGDEPKLFEPPKEHANVLQYLMSQDEDESHSRISFERAAAYNLALFGKPLFIMPGSWFETKGL